jgi:hypothetical protein
MIQNPKDRFSRHYLQICKGRERWHYCQGPRRVLSKGLEIAVNKESGQLLRRHRIHQADRKQ